MQSIGSKNDTFDSERLSQPDSRPRPRETQVVKDWRDRLGICLSILCLVHCLMTPIVMAIVPVGVALGFWQHGIHQLFLLVVPMVALIAFIPGWRQHRDIRVWIWGSIGIALLASGVAFAEHYGHGGVGLWTPLAGELLLTIAGGSCLIRAHLLNRALCACCDHGHDHAL